MALSADFPVSPFFRLGEFPCWSLAVPAQVARLEETGRRVLTPVRERWGPTVPTSWMRWRDGCALRSGAHGRGGTVDFTVPGANLRAVFEWGIVALLHHGYIGRWILEPATSSQGAHIHVAPVRDMVDAFGPAQSEILALVEVAPDTYEVPPGGAPFGRSGTLDRPIEIEGLEVTVEASGGLPWGWWIGAGALLAALAARDRR